MRTWSMLPLIVLSASCLPLSNQANGERNVLTFNQEVVFDAVPVHVTAAFEVLYFPMQHPRVMASLDRNWNRYETEAVTFVDGHCEPGSCDVSAVNQRVFFRPLQAGDSHLVLHMRASDGTVLEDSIPFTARTVDSIHVDFGWDRSEPGGLVGDEQSGKLEFTSGGETFPLPSDRALTSTGEAAELLVNAFGAFTMKSLHAGMNTFRVEADGHLLELEWPVIEAKSISSSRVLRDGAPVSSLELHVGETIWLVAQASDGTHEVPISAGCAGVLDGKVQSLRTYVDKGQVQLEALAADSDIHVRWECPTWVGPEVIVKVLP